MSKLIILLSFIPSILLYVHLPANSFVTLNDKDYYGLGKEMPSILSVFDELQYKGNNSPKYLGKDKEELLLKLTDIIGSLPNFEQTFLYQSLNFEESNSKLFDENKYLELMKANDGEGFKKLIESLKNVIEHKAKRFASSLGCLKSASGRFGFNSFEDDLMEKQLFYRIEEIAKYLDELAGFEFNFYKELLMYSLKQRFYLLTVTTSAENFDTSSDGKLILKKNPDYKNLITSYKGFIDSYTAKFKEIQQKAFEAVIYVSNLKGCIDEKKGNKNAGKSSEATEYARTTFKKSKMIGVNGANGRRHDNKTQNNFTLDHGFGFGNAYVFIPNKRESTDFDINGFQSPDWKIHLDASLNSLISINASFCGEDSTKTGCTEWNTFIVDAQKMLSSSSETKKNLAFSVKDTISMDDKYFTLFVQNNNKNCDSDTDPNCIKCEINDDYAYLGGEKEKISFEDGEYKGSQTDLKSPKDVDIVLICKYGVKYVIARENNNFDFMANGKSIEEAKYDIVQGCFASFSSGGRNDKDVCRGQLTKKCGIALDHQCKLSGFYDFVNELPLPQKDYPTVCEDPTNEECFDKIINEYFISGGIIPKASSIFGYGLIGQSLSRFYPPEKNNIQKSSEAQQAVDTNWVNEYITIYDNSFTSVEPNLRALLLDEVDRSYALLYNNSFRLKISLFGILFLVAALL